MTFYKKVKVSEEYFSSTTKRALTFLCKRVNGPDIVHFLALFCLNMFCVPLYVLFCAPLLLQWKRLDAFS